MRDKIRQQCRLTGDKSPEFRIRMATILRDAAEAVLREEVVMAREVYAVSWRRIGEALGVSQQAAHHKYVQVADGEDRS